MFDITYLAKNTVDELTEGEACFVLIVGFIVPCGRIKIGTPTV